MLVCVAAFLVDFPVVGETKVLTEGLGMPFMMQAWWLIVCSCVIHVVVSLLTTPPSALQTDGLTLSSPLAFLKEENGGIAGAPVAWSAILIAVMITLYSLFG